MTKILLVLSLMACGGPTKPAPATGSAAGSGSDELPLCENVKLGNEPVSCRPVVIEAPKE